MLENAAIDVAIGLILMYLMLSLLCTVINEFIATKLSLRSSSLASAIEALLDNDPLRAAFYNHGLIVGTKLTVKTGTQSAASAVTSAVTKVASAIKIAAMRLLKPAAAAAAAAAPAVKTVPGAMDDHPSYLSGHTVALALIASLSPGTPIPGIPAIRDAVEKLPPDSQIRSALLSCLTEAQHDFAALQMSIATWFDNAMDRLSGAYKRQIKLISMLVGLVVAIAFNADSFNVATTLWKDPDRRAAAVEMAKTVVQRGPPADTKTTADTKTPADPKTAAEQQKAADEKQKAADKTLMESIGNTETTLRSLPIGWSCPANPQTAASTTTLKQGVTWQEAAKQYWQCAHKQKIKVLQILGWLLTAAALSLGAPFWFDLLNQIINLRGAGAKPKRADAHK
jgi:hypothetical protein